MVLDEWEHEMCRMLDSFANQAIKSLGKINRRFVTLGRPFDEKFRQHFLKMSNQRLDLSYDTVLFANESIQHKESDATSNFNRSTEENVHVLNSVKNENVNCGDLIEIFDSDDDEDSQESKVNLLNDLTDEHIEMAENSDPPEHSICNRNPNGVHDEDNESEVKPPVKIEPNDDAMEVVDLPLVEFDPNGKNDEPTEVGSNEADGGTETRRSSPPSNNQLKHIGGKRFKCKHCDRSFESMSKLKRHQRVHTNGMLAGVKADFNGLYQCTLCVRQFTDLQYLSLHMKLHKNNEHLHYCAQCLCPFDREAAKDRHEICCDGRHYQCHLCKVYVTKLRGHMQHHMRTHSGAKPFCCTVCSNSFREKKNLRRHLNRAHNRNRS